MLFDQAINVGPNYAYAFCQKSVPFFKRGLFAEGNALIGRAIELEPHNYLYYKAYYYFYNRSYDLCIKDLGELYSAHNVRYVTTPVGELEMRLLLGMAYAHLGNVEKGIEWIQNLMEEYKIQSHLKGFYDHFCLGVLYLQNNELDLAKAEFEKQLNIDHNFASTYYYLGLIMKREFKNALSQEYFEEALSKINRKDGGYSLNIFTGFNTEKTVIENILKELIL